VSRHAVASIQRTWKHGSRKHRVQAVCDPVGGAMPDCPGNPERGFRKPLSASRGGKPSVNIVRMGGGLPEACVMADKPAQVKRLRDIAEAANMAHALGEPSTRAERMAMWTSEGGRAVQPWARWVRITEGASE